MVRKLKKTRIKRKILAKLNKQELVNPTSFLIPKRIDIAAKTIFARSYVEGNSSSWPEEVYRESIRAFNNFYEDNPPRNSFEDFKKSFIHTIEGVMIDDGWKHKKPVERNKNFIMNGAHRVAASIVLEDEVNATTPKQPYEHVWDYNFFKSQRGDIFGIDGDVLDYTTIEYVSLKKKNVFIVVLFPAAEGYRDKAHKHLMSIGEIVNMKSFEYNEFVPREVIKQLYFDGKNDQWNIGLDFTGANHKASDCFDGKGDLQIYVLEASLDEATRIKEKDYLRSLWNKGKNSVHITDTIEEANRVVRMFFNENSRRFMKIEREQEFCDQNTYDMFEEYMRLAPKNIIQREKIAIEGSMVMDLLNIRKAKDLDYISMDSNINFRSDSIERHNSLENSYHSQSIDEILTNPKYYLYYKGFKFVDVLVIDKYKKVRAKITNDSKDKTDLKSIREFLKKNPQYGK